MAHSVMKQRGGLSLCAWERECGAAPRPAIAFTNSRENDGRHGAEVSGRTVVFDGAPPRRPHVLGRVPKRGPSAHCTFHGTMPWAGHPID